MRIDRYVAQGKVAGPAGQAVLPEARRGRRARPTWVPLEADSPRLLLVGAEWFEDTPGGLNRYLADLAGSLPEAGIDARAVVLGPAASSPPTFWPSGRADASLGQRLAAVYRACRAQASHVDVVDVHFALYGLLPLLVGPRRLRRLPLIVHFQGPWARESRAVGASVLVCAAKRWTERAVYRRASVAVALSESFAEVLSADYGVDPRRIHVVPPGVDLERFCPGDRPARRAEHGVGRDTFVAVCVRRAVPRMGLETLLEAWGQVQAELADARLFIAGDGTQALTGVVGGLPRPGDVHLVGKVDDATVRGLYQAADCSVVPSLALEGFGLVTLESLACGTPPIVTRVGGLPDAVSGLDPSLVVSPRDSDALARRLVAAARGELPARGDCRLHAERFSWQEAARRHAGLVRQVARLPGGRGGRGGRPRVVYVDHCARLSGGELALVRLLGALDVEAHVVLGEDGPLVPLLEAAGAAVHVLALPAKTRDHRRDRVGVGSAGKALRAGAYALRLALLLRRLEPDLVHTNSLKAALYGGMAGRLAGVPVVWHIRDRIADDYLSPSGVRLVRGAAGVLPTAVIANSAATLATLELRSKPAVVIPSPVDVGQAEAPRPAGGEALRIGIVGRLAPWKGQDMFLRAFAAAFGEGREQAVVVGAALFGEGAYEDELRALVSTLGLAGRVEFRGFRPDVGAELTRLEVVVHASTLPEPFGQVVVEAMAAGRAVVVPDAGGPAEIVRHDIDGLLYPMGDQAALAQALRRLATDADLRRRLGEAARCSASRYLPEAVASQVLELYSRVLDPAREKRGPEPCAG